MLKPDSLRAALTAAIVGADGARLLERDPDKLAIFIDKGRIAARPRNPETNALGFEWRYRLVALLTDFTGDVDAVAFAVIMWIAENQRELLEDFAAGSEAVKFEADVIDSSTIDLQLELELTEAVAATPIEGGYSLEHRAEPYATPPFEDLTEAWPFNRLVVGGRVIFDKTGG